MASFKRMAPRRGRGRPVSSDLREDKRIFLKWSGGRYGTYAALAWFLKKPESDVRLALDRERKRRARPARKRRKDMVKVKLDAIQCNGCSDRTLDGAGFVQLSASAELTFDLCDGCLGLWIQTLIDRGGPRWLANEMQRLHLVRADSPIEGGPPPPGAPVVPECGTADRAAGPPG